MTEAEAKIVLLEDALHQAQSLVEFLHGRLTNPQYRYAYPELTQRELQNWARLAPRPPACHHSNYAAGIRAGCHLCMGDGARRKPLLDAQEVLGLKAERTDAHEDPH